MLGEILSGTISISCDMSCDVSCIISCDLYHVMYHVMCMLIAVEFIDLDSSQLVTKHFPSVTNPLSVYPFYTLIETAGSHEHHDKQVSILYHYSILFMYLHF